MLNTGLLFFFIYLFFFGTTVDVGCVEGVSVEVEWHRRDTAGVKYVIMRFVMTAQLFIRTIHEISYLRTSSVGRISSQTPLSFLPSFFPVST